jgi:HK97 family phage prohead protease
MRDHLIVPVEWKAATGGGPGELEGYVSVFGNVDQGGDVVLPGAFANTLRYWSKQAQPMPLIADHELSTEGVIGSVHNAKEDTTGLRIKARFSSDPKAQSVRTKMIEGHVKGLSFTYEAVKHHLGTVAGKSVRFLQEVKIFEATVTPFPMNTLAIGSAKAAMTSASINDLPDSAFAYIEPGGTKDAEGKTTPRSLRHFPVHDEAHARNALARAPQSPFGKQAMPKILAACRKFGIKVSDESESASADLRDAMHKVMEIPSAAARKAAADVLLDEYLTVTEPEDEADGPAGEPDAAADAAAGDAPAEGGTTGTADGPTPREYASQIMNSGTADGSPASLDALEARILNSLGGAS